MYINLFSAGIICWCQQWLCLSKLWTSQPQSILNLVLSSWANELPSKSLHILYGLQNKAFQQTSELLTFSSQIKLIFTRLFKSHYAVGIMWARPLSLLVFLSRALCWQRMRNTCPMAECIISRLEDFLKQHTAHSHPHYLFKCLPSLLCIEQIRDLATTQHRIKMMFHKIY